MNDHGFVRISCVSLRVTVANPSANAAEILGVLERATDSDVVLLPELCVTGYTCADLFAQSSLLDAGLRAIAQVTQATAGARQLVVVGAPVPCGNSLFNCAIAISNGAVLGVVPKQYLPNYKEFYESRWFCPASGREPAEIDLGGRHVPFGIDLLFEGKAGSGKPAGVVVGIEICEDLWVPIPPSLVPGHRGGNGTLEPIRQ